MTKKTKDNSLVVLRVAVAIGIFILAIINYDSLRNIDVRAIVDNSTSEIFAIGAIWLIYLIKSTFFIIPAMIVYVAVGMAFSPITAIFINFIGILLEVTATYILGVFLGGEQVNNMLGKNKAGKKLLE